MEFIIALLVSLLPPLLVIPFLRLRRARETLQEILRGMPRLGLYLPGIIAGATTLAIAAATTLLFTMQVGEPPAPPEVIDHVETPPDSLVEFAERGGLGRNWQLIVNAPDKMEFSQSAVVTAQLRLKGADDPDGIDWAVIESRILSDAVLCGTLSASSFQIQMPSELPCWRTLPAAEDAALWQWSLFPEDGVFGKQTVLFNLVILPGESQEDRDDPFGPNHVLFQTLQIDVHKSFWDRHANLVATSIAGATVFAGALITAVVALLRPADRTTGRSRGGGR